MSADHERCFEFDPLAEFTRQPAGWDIELVAAVRKGHTRCVTYAMSRTTTRYEAIVAAATAGHHQCMAALRDFATPPDPEWRECTNAALLAAAQHGHVECARRALEWGASNVEAAFGVAIDNNRARCGAFLAKRVASIHYQCNVAVKRSARRGRHDCMRLAWRLGGNDCYGALNAAILGKDLECIRTGIKIFMVHCTANGAVGDWTVMVRIAIHSGNVAGLRLIWKASRGTLPSPFLNDKRTRADIHIHDAATYGNAAVMEFLREQGATRFESAFQPAAAAGQLQCLQFAQRWADAGNVDYIHHWHLQAIRAAMKNSQLACLKQVLDWGRIDASAVFSNLTAHSPGGGWNDDFETSPVPLASIEALYLRGISDDAFEMAASRLVGPGVVPHRWLAAVNARFARWRRERQALRLVEAYIALEPTGLPLYVVLWITDWVYSGTLALHERVRILEGVRRSIRALSSRQVDTS